MSRASDSHTPERGHRITLAGVSQLRLQPPCGRRLYAARAAWQRSSFRPLRPCPSPCLVDHSMQLECLAQYRAQANMVLQTCFVRSFDTADVRSAHDRFLRSLCRRMPERISNENRETTARVVRELSRTTNSACSRPMMRPNPDHHTGSLCCAATGSRPWDAQAAHDARTGSTSYRCRRDAVGARPYPALLHLSHVAAEVHKRTTRYEHLGSSGTGLGSATQKDCGTSDKAEGALRLCIPSRRLWLAHLGLCCSDSERAPVSWPQDGLEAPQHGHAGLMRRV